MGEFSLGIKVIGIAGSVKLKFYYLNDFYACSSSITPIFYIGGGLFTNKLFFITNG